MILTPAAGPMIYTSAATATRPVLYLHPKQMEVRRDRHRFRCVVAGRRWGKTQLAKIEIIGAATVPKQLIWYVAPSYRMAKQIMWPELLDSIPKKWIKRINETLMMIELKNKTRIELKGADNPDSLRGVGIHFLVMDEVQDIDPEAWTKVLRPTLASTRGRALFIGTPKSYNFLYELYMLGKRGVTYTDPQGVVRNNVWASWQFPTITSPFISEEEIEAAKADMDEKSFNQEFNASFETMSGRVYYPFNRRVHVGHYPFNPRLPIWIGQDFNLDPMCSVVLQPQEDGKTLWAVDEIVLKGSNTEEVCDEIEKRYYRWMKQVTIFPDPAGQYRQHARGESDLDIFRQKGFKRLKYRRKHPLVADRVNSVNRMLRAADGTIRLYVNDKCENLVESLEQTIYKAGTREIDKDANIEHITDAVGYPIEYQFPVRKIVVVGRSL